MSEKLIKFVEKKNLWFSLSAFMIGIGFVMMGIRVFNSENALNYGIDFSGGSTMILRFEELNTNLKQAHSDVERKEMGANFTQRVRNALTGFGLQNSNIQVAQNGDLIVKTATMDANKNDRIKNAIQTKIGNFDILELDFIGPTIGSELRARSIWIVLLVSSALMLYITWRFELAFGIATLIATLHDALFMVSFAALFNIEISVEFIAAILTIIGYSMNDTVVIFDRIRENLGKLDVPLPTLVNMSLVQTLSRTFYTVLTTAVMTGCLYLFGGATIKEFSLVLLVGIGIGTYSSLFVAAPAFALLYKKKVQQPATTPAATTKSKVR